MKTLNQFKQSLILEQSGSNLSVHLKSLWYDGKGDWHRAHALIDQLKDQPSALIHAYLHRKEGDISNADYWYEKAHASRPQVSLEKEWEQLVVLFL
jgi:hypothetical protein